MSNSRLSYNRLKNENSLYLKQHQKNPIHWWAYGPEAIQLAKDENKPIFLSVGYSSCHWCHVMAHESFENEEVAEFLNNNYVCIKVDKEEYPDLDNYYQKAAQLFSNNGGWPLSVFLLPDMRPFFAGTYFPMKKNNQGPTFLELITELDNAYKNNHEQVLSNASEVHTRISKPTVLDSKVPFEGHFPPPTAILEALKNFQDQTYGGYGAAPKFPQFAFYEWALEQMLEGMIQKEHGEFIVKSLEHMLMGGINDHARGGIHRYSTDEKWLVPHFEKMLYDQAGFLKVLTKLSLIYPSPLVYDTLINTLDYLENEMLSDDKYFFSAQDADSEGVEGLYFTFTEEEFEDLINQNDDEQETMSKKIDDIKKWFNISTSGNFDHNLNVISLNPQYRDEIYIKENWDIVRKVRRAIVSERKNRMPPMTDNKGVAGWNFMMISALCDVVQYSQLDVIKRNASNILNSVIEPVYNTFLVQSNEGMKMRHSTTLPFSSPLLEDFVLFAESQIRLYEISGNPVFKQNFKDSMEFITKEFLENDHMLTRARFANDLETYPNVEYNLFDSSFKSVVSTFIILAKKAGILFLERDYFDMIENLTERAKHHILKYSPIGGGEAMRGLTYPDDVYRLLKVPRSFLQDEKFIKTLPYFLTRFSIDYHDEDDSWQICTMKSCELNDRGIDTFVKTLLPNNQE